MTTPTQGEHAQTALAHELFAAAQLAPGEGIEDAVSRIAAALTAATAQPAPQGVAYAELPTPESYLFQHDETGLTQFVDAQQVEWGFQQNNPRLRRIGGAYTADQMRDFADRTHALRASNGQAPATQQTLERNAVPAEWLEQAYREGWAACRDAETIGGESEDWSFGNSTANSRMIDAQQAVHQPSPTAQAAPAAERQYINGVKTVADLVNNLLLLDQSLPIYAAQHIQIANRRRTITVPPTVSRERVKDERWIGEGDELNAAVIWTRAEAPAAGAVAWTVEPTQEMIDAVLRLVDLETSDPEDHRYDNGSKLATQICCAVLAAAPTPAAQADSVPAPVRDVEREAFKAAHRHLELDEVPDAWARPMFKHSHVEASWLGWIARAARVSENGQPATQGNELLTVAERNIRSFLRSATFKSESDREAALSCVDVLWAAARAPTDSVLEDAARLAQIEEAIRDYHHALDMRKHGGLAESVAFNSICQTMGMTWNQGEEAARRAARKQGGV